MSQDAGVHIAGDSTARSSHVNWAFPAILVSLVIIATMAIYRETAWSMVAIWLDSETFAHGFIIFPISIYLVWRKRHELALLQPEPVSFGPAVLVLPGFTWLLGYLSDVQVVQQFCFVGTIILLVWALLGWKVTKLLAFPLGYLLFAVPFGKFLVPFMIDFTAVFAVAALRLSGIPVFAEGTSFSTPGANWVVLEVCSGMRYLIAALVMGTLYAYLTYRSQIRRILFILVTIALTFFATGMRVYIVVMIGHFVDMKYAKGFDHLFIGWVFFGIIMFLLFLIGSFWREDESQAPADSMAPAMHDPGRKVARSRFAVIGIISLAVLSVWPLTGSWMNSRADYSVDASLTVPAASEGWSLSPELVNDWVPVYVGLDTEVHQTYRKEGRQVGLYLPFYKAQRQGAELINDGNSILETRHAVWTKVGHDNLVITVAGREIRVVQTIMRSDRGRLLVYHWNWFDGDYISSSHKAKLLEAKNRLLGRHTPASAIIVYTYLSEENNDAVDTMQLFLDEMLPAIERSLDQAAGNDS